MSDQQSRQAYWKANLKLVAMCLVIWFVVSYVFGILLVDQLNAIPLGGYKLGFWFAQQGSIIIFVILIAIYVWRMDKLDAEYGIDEYDSEVHHS